MINRFLFLALVLFASSGFSQNNSFSSIKNKIHEKFPEADLEDRLIAVNFWSANDEQSRKNNIAFEKALKVYSGARLKGGSDGLIVLTVNGDNLSTEATILLHKDNIKLSLPFASSEISSLIPGTSKNLVYDSNGKEVYRDLNDTQVFDSIHKLITR